MIAAGSLWGIVARGVPLNLTELQNWSTEDAAQAHAFSEDERLVVLASFDAQTLIGDEELARITRFAAQLLGARSAAVSLVDAERQRFIASEGLEITETARDTSLCAHTMLGHDLLEVLDASEDPRFADFSLVTGDAHLRYYVGAPLVSAEGAPLGALCITDTTARTEPLNEFQREGIAVLAEAVMRRLQAHRQSNLELRESAQRMHSMLNSVPDIAWSAAPGPKWDYFNARFTEVTGMSARETIDDWREVIHPEDFEASLVKFGEALETASFFEDEWRLRQADGSYRWVISRAVPSTDDPTTARWFGTLTDIHDRYQISQERELLAGELAHRIKNVFSVINGLVTLHAGQDPELKSFSETLTRHIRALSRAQEYALNADTAEEASLMGLIVVLMTPYGVPGESGVSVTGDADVNLVPRAATPMALVFHELATNSAKYGALSSPEGKVDVSIARADGNVHITWTESDGPSAEPPQDTGFGSRLVKMSIEHQLGGNITYDWREEGLCTSISVPEIRITGWRRTQAWP